MQYFTRFPSCDETGRATKRIRANDPGEKRNFMDVTYEHAAALLPPIELRGKSGKGAVGFQVGCLFPTCLYSVI